MVYTELTKKAMEIAYNCHAGQIDKSGAPYIFHPIHLAEQLYTEDEVCVALLHDAYEDNPMQFLDYMNTDEMADKFLKNDNIIQAIHLLSRNENPNISYFEYINNIKSNRIAHIVKVLDIRHNLDSTRLRINDTLRERYIKALKMLGDEIVTNVTVITSANNKRYSVYDASRIAVNGGYFYFKSYPYTIKIEPLGSTLISGNKYVIDLALRLTISLDGQNRVCERTYKKHISTKNARVETHSLELIKGHKLFISFILNKDATGIEKIQIRERI